MEIQHIQNIMDADILTVEPEATLREAAQLMSERNVGAAIVVDPTSGTPGIITERDLLHSIAAGQELDMQHVVDNRSPEVTSIPVDASLDQALQKMSEGNFRHLLVIDGGDAVGIVSMRDLVRALTSQ